MKKLVSVVLLFILALSLSANKQVKKYDFKDFDVHIYSSQEAMGDVSIVVEGDSGIVVLEPQSFYKSIDDLNSYIKKLNKPVVKVIANYHFGGIKQYDISKVVVVEPMIEFMKSPQIQKMLKSFDKAFEGAMDTRIVEPKQTIKQNSKHKWSGVDFVFSKGATTDFPASSVNIGDKIYYMHFSPSKKHPSPHQITSVEAIDETLVQLNTSLKSNAEIFVGSHGTVATRSDVEFMIKYLDNMKQLLKKCKDSDCFTQRLIAIYPNLEGVQNLQDIALFLYKDEVKDIEIEKVRIKIKEYLESVSNTDIELAKTVWDNSENSSLINPFSHFFGFESIVNDFMIKAFSRFQYKKVNSISEVIKIHKNYAIAEIYWIFDAEDKKGVKSQIRGRESLVFSKIDGEWRLQHVHYSGI